MYIEEEGEARRKFINCQATFQRSIDISQTIGERKGQFLYCCCASFANMVAANADRVPAWHMTRAKLDSVDHQA